MKKTVKLVLAFSFLATMTMAAFAQTKEPSISDFQPKIVQKSNSFNATANTIRTDVNYSMDPRYFQDAEFSNFLTYLNVNADKSTPHKGGYLDLGLAKNWNDFRFGGYYYGDLWGNAYGNKASIPLGTEETSKNTCTNKFGLFTSFKDFALRLDFSIEANSKKIVTTTTSKNWKGETTTNTDTKESSSTKFDFAGTLGASFDFAPFTLKPLASFGYCDDNGNNENAFLMNLGTDFVFGKGSVEHIAGILYLLSAGSAETSNMKISHPTNAIDLYYRAHLDLGSKAEIGAAINMIHAFDSNTVTYNNGKTDPSKSYFAYVLLSDIAIGVKYNVSPSQFAINAGIDMALPNVMSVSYPESDIDDYETTSNCDFNTNIYTGCELNLSKNWTLDTSLSFQIGNVDKNLFNNLTLGVSYRK